MRITGAPPFWAGVRGPRSWSQQAARFSEFLSRRTRFLSLPRVDPKAVATLIVASLEGAFMMSRIQRNDEALRHVQSHLNRYLDGEVAVSR